jgi:hypothetical protein
MNVSQQVHVEIFDTRGRLVSRPYQGILVPGEHDLSIDLSGCEKGFYLLHFRAGSQLVLKKVIVN